MADHGTTPESGGSPENRDSGVSASARAPLIPMDIRPEDRARLTRNALRASKFLKAISHEGRLMILCHLATGEKSVTELEDLLQARQAAVSQQLARLRREGLVMSRREGKAIYYSLTDERPSRIIEVVYDLFCREAESDP